MGKALAGFLDSGELLADGPANDLMMARLLQPDAGRGFILDGYPTTEVQARALDKWLRDHNLPKPAVVILDIPENVARSRMKRRRRADDELANIERRLRNYRDAGTLVERWYGSQSVVRVDESGTPAEVALRISSGLDALKAGKGLRLRPPDGEGLKRREPE